MSQIRTFSFSGKSLSTLRMDMIISIKNYSVYRAFMDLFLLPNDEQIVHTVGGVTDLMTKGGKSKVRTFCMDRTFSLAEYYACRVPEQMDYEAMSMIKKEVVESQINVIKSQEKIDYVPSCELPLQIYGSDNKSAFYVFPILFVGERTQVAAVEDFLIEVGSSQHNVDIVQNFIKQLPLSNMIKREIPTSYFGFIPPNVNTVKFVKARIKQEERLDAKKKVKD